MPPQSAVCSEEIQQPTTDRDHPPGGWKFERITATAAAATKPEPHVANNVLQSTVQEVSNCCVPLLSVSRRRRRKSSVAMFQWCVVAGIGYLG